MNPSDPQPSSSSAGQPAHTAADAFDGNCVSVPHSDRDSEAEIAAIGASSDSMDGAGDVSSLNPEWYVRTDIRSYDGPDIYKMSAHERGICLIINNIKFEKEEETRHGAEKDGEALRQVFRQLGFKVHYATDLTGQEMITIFERYSQIPDHENADCFVAIILTHGWYDGKLLGVDNNLVSLEKDVIGRFNNENCVHLIQKPKLFFVQACRGDKHDLGVCLQNVADAAGFAAGAEQQVDVTMIPSWSDTLMCFATIDGYVALRNIVTGSWFVDALIRTLCEHACDTELHDLLIKVNNKLMCREGESRLKQSLETVYRGWSRKLYFNPGHSTL